MTSSSLGSSDRFFYTKEEVVDYLLQNILANKKRLVGTEWEMFFVDETTGAPITKQNGQRAFEYFAKAFSAAGLHVRYQTERIADGTEKIIGLDINGHGSIQLEAGHQFEFACAPHKDPTEIDHRNRMVHAIIVQVAAKLNHQVVFTGYRKGYATKAEGVDRSRGVQWERYYRDRFGEDPALADAFNALREAQNGTASVQVTLDAGADEFHEFYQAALLVEPALTLAHTNSLRPSVSVSGYGRFIPTQVEPITTVWGTKDPREAIEAIVDRLMKLEVPFLPNPSIPGTYIAEPLDADKRPPTVRELMEQGRLSELSLNGAASFFYTRPALRSVMMGLLELRGVDSQNNPGAVDTIVREASGLIYNDQVRKKLLADYAHLTPDDIAGLHAAAAKPMREALATVVAGRTMAEFMKDILGRVETIAPSVSATASEVFVDRRKATQADAIVVATAPTQQAQAAPVRSGATLA